MKTTLILESNQSRAKMLKSKNFKVYESAIQFVADWPKHNGVKLISLGDGVIKTEAIELAHFLADSNYNGGMIVHSFYLDEVRKVLDILPSAMYIPFTSGFPRLLKELSKG